MQRATFTLIACLLLAMPAMAADTVVVCPAELRDALRPWAEYRQQQGHRLAIIEPAADAASTRRAISQAGGAGGVQAIVLIGDAQADANDGAAAARRTVPAHQAAARVNVHFGSEPAIATDNWYADFDDDGVPDAAIGRLTADTPEDLHAMVEKILAYERSRDWGRWRQRINVVAGTGGFGAMVDSLIESAARTLLTAHIPPAYRTTMTYSDWRSPYCPSPVAACETVVERLSEGCLFWIYLGHANRREFDFVRAPDGPHRILHADDAARLSAQGRSPIALLLACYAGAYDGPDDCLAEELLRAPGGPVAVVSGSRVTMPYGMTVLGMKLLEHCFERRQPTLGDLLLAAKRASVLDARDSAQCRQIDMLAQRLNPVTVDLAQERAEHLALFNLLGDPLLSLRYGQRVDVVANSQPTAGETLEISASSPIDGIAEVELVMRRDRLPDVPRRLQYDTSPAGRRQALADYAQANDLRIAHARTMVVGGKLICELPISSDAWGPCHVRVYVEGQSDFALGATDVNIRPLRAAAADNGIGQ